MLILCVITSQGVVDSSDVRVITYNLRSGQGYGEHDGKTVAERMSIIGEAIKAFNPDLLIIQEPGSDHRYYDTLVMAMGSDYQYRLLKCSGYSKARQVGLLVFNTRVVIDSADYCIQGTDSRTSTLFNHWGRVVLRIDDQPLIVYGFKLAPRDRAEQRRRQIDLLEPYLKHDLAQQYPVLIAGDFNHRPIDPEYSRWQALGLVDTFEALPQDDGFTKMDELGDNLWVPYRRIDYLLCSLNLSELLVAPARVLREGLFVPQPPYRRWSLSDHLPVMATFRLP